MDHAICQTKKDSFVITRHFVIYCFEAHEVYKFSRLDDHSPLYSFQGWGFARKLVLSDP